MLSPLISSMTAVFLGGGLGAVGRYGVMLSAARILGHSLPYGTLLVNIGGSIIMGFLAQFFIHHWQPGPTIQLFFLTGFLGGFTTFSAFSLDLVTLIQDRETLIPAALYLTLSIVLSVGGLLGGIYLSRILGGS